MKQKNSEIGKKVLTYGLDQGWENFHYIKRKLHLWVSTLASGIDVGKPYIY